MSSTSILFDFSNEGDCIIANDSLKLHQLDNAADSISNDFTFTYMDLMMLSALYDTLLPDVELTNEDMSQLKKQKKDMPSIMPFIDVVDLNESSKDLVNEVKPNSAVVIGIKGDF